MERFFVTYLLSCCLLLFPPESEPLFVERQLGTLNLLLLLQYYQNHCCNKNVSVKFNEIIAKSKDLVGSWQEVCIGQSELSTYFVDQSELSTCLVDQSELGTKLVVQLVVQLVDQSQLCNNLIGQSEGAKKLYLV